MSPIAQTDGHDAPGLLDEAVPVVAAVRDDAVVVLEDPVGKLVVAHELPYQPWTIFRVSCIIELAVVTTFELKTEFNAS